VPALLGLAGAGLVAALLRQPMFLVFGTLGALVALGSWAAQVVAGRRRRRREQVAYQRAQHAHLRDAGPSQVPRPPATVPTVATAHGTINSAFAALVGVTHPDAHCGRRLGELPWPPATAAPAIADTNCPRPAAAGRPWPAAAALCGTGVRRSPARGRTARLCGPADLRLVVTDRPAVGLHPPCPT
jgi:hypothetical protein